MEPKLFTAFGKVASGLKAIVNLPKAERELVIKVVGANRTLLSNSSVLFTGQAQMYTVSKPLASIDYCRTRLIARTISSYSRTGV